MDTWVQDLRYAVRALVKKPAFTAVAVASLALGIGANTAIFTVINAIFLHPLDIEDPSRVVELFTHDTNTVQGSNQTLTPTSLPNYEDYRDRNDVLTGLSASFGTGLQWTDKGETTGVPGLMTSANYFDVLGVKPALGRFFGPDEDLKKATPVAVLSHSIWVTRFGSDPNVVNRSITLNDVAFTIIGVAPPGFKGTASLAGPDRIWIPLGMRDQILTGQLKTLMPSRRFRWISMIGRLKPGVSIGQAQAAIKTIASSLEQQYPDVNKGRTIDITSVSDSALGINNRGQFVQVGSVLMAMVGVVLLIACANLANLLLAQAARREKDMSIRAAMGANRSRLVRQMLVESTLLSVCGGALGLVVAYWARNALWSARPPFLGQASIDLSLDPRVLGFTAGVSILTGVMFGIVPAIKLSQTNLVETLKQGGRSGSPDRGHGRVRNALVAVEIGLATVALVGAGLFVRSMRAAETMDLGFDAPHVGFLFVNPGGQHYDQARGEQFYADAVERARQAPGVRAAAAASLVPLAGGQGVLLTVFPQGKSQEAGDRGSLIGFGDISPGYFDTIRVAFKSGRDFTDFDRDQSTAVAVVNEAVARQLWPGQNAIGKRFSVVTRPDIYEVVGVVANHVVNNVGEDPVPQIWRPLRQEYAQAAAIVVRTDTDPAARITGARDAIQTLDRNMPLRNTGTIADQIEQGLWAPRMGAALLSIFGGLALLLAMVGIYGLMSYTVSQRTPEIGFRMAIGASASSVLWLIMRQGLVLAVSGAAIGIAAAALLGRFIANLLFGIQPQDPATLGAVTGVLSLVALVACYVPARRAMRVDPLVALRNE